MNPTAVAVGYLFPGDVIVPAILHFFKTRVDWIDVGLAAVGGAAASLIPAVGGIASYAAMIGILYWRLGQGLFSVWSGCSDILSSPDGEPEARLRFASRTH
jgi:hypothetical protein